MQHIEFFNRDHFYQHFHRRKAKNALSTFIDFFWETDFDALWSKYPDGFTDALFPDVGYTYMINLGTPFKMQLDEQPFDIKADIFLPRYKNILTLHTAGNKVFGIKFKVSPIIFLKKVNFYEYRDSIFPLVYLLDKVITDKVRTANTFDKRVAIISSYYEDVITQYKGSLKYVDIVTDVLKQYSNSNFTTSVEQYAAMHNISVRTLQRYFEAATSISSKQALQITRIRKAITAFVQSPSTFNYAAFGYFDYSHFYKYISKFIKNHKMAHVQSPLQLLQGSGIINY
ncbi:AraC family transcriptional regulator [Ilyomonas limi]|uniref:AraC family transcriptional regulator n=1 Tax=Ilyomonas limi TaxID=2575867 RepID=A0A4U3KQT7_9BACT|nr:AraC family transcriptional regulator [Ilyomonas limi]TKK64582.1 AraC family transcriptional regulator [Ilyomonas limi]